MLLLLSLETQMLWRAGFHLISKFIAPSFHFEHQFDFKVHWSYLRILQALVLCRIAVALTLVVLWIHQLSHLWRGQTMFELVEVIRLIDLTVIKIISTNRRLYSGLISHWNFLCFVSNPKFIHSVHQLVPNLSRHY